MSYFILLFSLVFGLMSTQAHAAANQDDHQCALTVENDSMGSGADRNYTSGVRASCLEHRQHPSLAARMFDKFIPMDMLNDSTNFTYSLGQNLYTPKDLTLHTPDPKDRPYTGFLYSSLALSTTHENHSDNVEVTAGVIGPAALGREAQQFIHTLLDAQQPQGWGYQLKNEPAFMVSWERLWPDTFHAEMDEVVFRAAPYAGTTLGNVFTYGNTGVIFQLLPKAYQSQNTPLRTRPALAGNGYSSIPDGDFAWCVFAGLEGRLVGRNIFLDGNSFANSASVGKKPLVADADVGVAFNYGPAQISYTLNWRSEEFYGQDNTDLFGSAAVTYRF